MTCILTKRGNLNTETHRNGGMPGEDEGRNPGKTSISQGTPKIARKPPEAGGEA